MNQIQSLLHLARWLLLRFGSRMEDTDLIACKALLPKWEPDLYTVGEVRRHLGQPWRCIRAHDSREDPQRSPGLSPQLWTVCHSRDLQYAQPFVEPTGDADAYRPGEYMLWTDANCYLCTRRDTYDGPDRNPKAWEIQA